AGGIKDVDLGDVVAADVIYNYHSGKAGDSFTVRPDMERSTYGLIQRAHVEAQSRNWLARRRNSCSEPNAVVAPIAAGEQVVVSSRSATYQFLRKHYDRAVAV